MWAGNSGIKRLPFDSVRQQYLVFISLPSNRKKQQILGHDATFNRILQRVSCDLTFVKRGWLMCHSFRRSLKAENREGSRSPAQRMKWDTAAITWKCCQDLLIILTLLSLVNFSKRMICYYLAEPSWKEALSPPSCYRCVTAGRLR